MGRPTLTDVRDAAVRIAPYAHRTPVATCSALDEMAGNRLFFKCENFQKAGAFKFRGACNAVFSLPVESARRGVLTHSSGNHGAALALAARLRGIPAIIVVPEGAPPVKRAAIEGYGARIVDCANSLDSRETTAARVLEETGATLIHPYDNDRIIAGQGTAALELVGEVGDLDLVLAPVGGGGLLSGTAIAVGEVAPTARVIAVEPAGADDAYRSFRAGHVIPQTDPRTGDATHLAADEDRGGAVRGGAVRGVAGARGGRAGRADWRDPLRRQRGSGCVAVARVGVESSARIKNPGPGDHSPSPFRRKLTIAP
jgi:threonine dehydratase/serine racemase